MTAPIRYARCTKCNQDFQRDMTPTEPCCDGGPENHKLINLCGELSVAVGTKLTCDLHEGHGTRHSGLDAVGKRWEWNSPVQSHREYRESKEREGAEGRMERHLDNVFGKEERKGTIPTVGRIVHYTNLGDRDGRFPPEVQAALITKVEAKPTLNNPELPSVEHGYSVSLHIFYEMGDFKMKDVPFTRNPAGSEGARGKWTWTVKV